MLSQDVDQIRLQAINLVSALDRFQLAYLNVLGTGLDDVQAAREARLLVQIGLPSMTPPKPAPKARKPRKRAKAEAVPKKARKPRAKVEMPALAPLDAKLLKSMPEGEDFTVKQLPLAQKLGGRRLIGLVHRLHKLGFIERVGIASNKVTTWKRLH